jgi:E3 ubiquitin-protein ligase UHRF1
MPTPYEKERNANIQRNKELLLSLSLDELKVFVPAKSTKNDAPPATKSRKRKSPPPRDADSEGEANAKVSKRRPTEDITNTSGMRRSARNAGKVVDYKREIVKASPEVISPAARNANNGERKNALERLHTPYVYLTAYCDIAVNAVV